MTNIKFTDSFKIPHDCDADEMRELLAGKIKEDCSVAEHAETEESSDDLDVPDLDLDDEDFDFE